MNRILCLLCFLLPLGASADKELVVRDGARGEFKLKVGANGELRAYPAPDPAHFQTPLMRPRSDVIDVVIYRNPQVEGEEDTREIGLLNVTDIFQIEGRIFAVTRTKGKIDSPSYLHEVRVRFGKNLNVLHLAMTGAFVYMGGMIAYSDQPQLNLPLRVIGIGMTVAIFGKMAWDEFVRLKGGHGSGYATQMNGDLVRVDSLIEEDGRTIDAMISPLGAKSLAESRSLREAIALGCGPLLSSNAPRTF